MIYLSNIRKRAAGLAVQNSQVGSNYSSDFASSPNAIGLGYTAADAAHASTPAEKGAAADFYNANLSAAQLKIAARATGTEAAIYVTGILLPWLQALLSSSNWSPAQAKLITDRIDLYNASMPRWLDRRTVDGELMHRAGLQLLQDDAQTNNALIAETQQTLLAQLGAFADPTTVAKFEADAAAAKAVTDRAAAATAAAVKAGTTYIPPGLQLPAPFMLPGIPASAASAPGSQQTTSTTPHTTAATPFSLADVPPWLWAIGGIGLALVIFDGKGKGR